VEQFADHSYDILVGTQMVSKGLDFKDVSLVAVLNADSLLTLPDFRATERAYQLLEQVSGRAGRRETQGKVIIQTYDPAQPVMQWVMRHDYRAFYDAAVAERSLLRYPPFVRMYQVVMRHANRQLLENAAQYARTLLASQLGDSVSDVIDPIVPKIQNLCYKNIIIRLPLNAGLKAVRASIISSLTQMTAQIQYHAVNYYVVVDP
jgi:primosomal protein N' (replication factor Y)